MDDWSVSKFNDADPNIVNVAAIYWAASVVSANGKIYSKMIPDIEAVGVDSDLKTAAQALLADAVWAYVVVWDKMAPTGNVAATEVSWWFELLVAFLSFWSQTLVFFFFQKLTKYLLCHE